MGRILVVFALCLFAVMPQRVCTCHGVELGHTPESAEPAEHDDHDCHCEPGGPFAEFLKSADVPLADSTFAALFPVITPNAGLAVADERPAVEHPPPRHVPLYITHLALLN